MDNNALNPAPETPTTPVADPSPVPLVQPETNMQTPVTPTEPVQTKKSKAPIIIAIIALVVVAGFGVAAALLLGGNNDGKYIENATQLTQKISSVNSESLVFFDADLEKLSADLFKNPDGEKFSSESYATYFDKEAKICLNDAEKRVDNIDGEMKVRPVSEAGKCELKLSDNDIIKYLANYYTKKYDLTVKAKDSRKYDDKYIIYTDKGAIYASFELKDKKITIEDDYEDLVAGYTSLEDIHGLIINYVKDAQKDKSEDDDQIVDVRLFNQDYFILQSTLPEAEAESFTEKLGEFLISKNVNNLELYTACYSYTLVEGETKINIDYKISLLIKDGVMTLEASSND